jgi:hypothetical protein
MNRHTCVYKNIVGPKKGKTCGRWLKGYCEGKPELCYLHSRYAKIYEPTPKETILEDLTDDDSNDECEIQIRVDSEATRKCRVDRANLLKIEDFIHGLGLEISESSSAKLIFNI